MVATRRVHHKLEICAADGHKLGEIPNVNVNDPDDPPFVNMSRIALHEFLLRPRPATKCESAWEQPFEAAGAGRGSRVGDPQQRDGR